MAGLELEKLIDREFISMPLRPRTMAHYTIRTSILDAVKHETAKFYGSVLDLGCGFMPYRQIVEAVPAVKRYVGMDLERSIYYGDAEPDLKWDGKRIAAADQSFDCVMATEFLEHHSEPETVLAEMNRVTKPGGRFFATVPFIWNLHEVPYDEYRYMPYSVERLVKNAGFREIEIKALGGWNLALAQMIGLWVEFPQRNRILRAILRVVLFPFYYLLVKTDVKPTRFDGGANSMFTGLSITAIK